jgi:hypothetical protein
MRSTPSVVPQDYVILVALALSEMMFLTVMNGDCETNISNMYPWGGEEEKNSNDCLFEFNICFLIFDNAKNVEEFYPLSSSCSL